MEHIRFKPDEFKLVNFISYYNDNIEELLHEYPNDVSRICLIDRDYMDVITYDEDYENIEDVNDYIELLLNGENALLFPIGKTYEGCEKVEFIDGKKYSLNHYMDDIYEDDSTIKDIGELSLNVDNLIGLLFDFEEEDGEIVKAKTACIDDNLQEICSIYTFTIINPMKNTELPVVATLNPSVNSFKNL